MPQFAPNISFSINEIYVGNSGGVQDAENLVYTTNHRKIMFTGAISNTFLVEISKDIQVDLQVHCYEIESEEDRENFCKFTLLDNNLCLASINLDLVSFKEFSAFFEHYFPKCKENVIIGISIETPKSDIIHTIKMTDRYKISDFTYEYRSKTT